MRRSVTSLLRELGYLETDEAEDGEIALQKLRSGGFDFVITDIRMPRMNGIELLRAIRADAALKKIPVLVVSGEAVKEDLVAAAQAGANSFLMKPFTRKALEQTLIKITRGPVTSKPQTLAPIRTASFFGSSS